MNKNPDDFSCLHYGALVYLSVTDFDDIFFVISGN